MKPVLIIYAHPKTAGHCPIYLEEVESYLKGKSIPYELIDLYAINYDPVLHESELYSAGNREVSAQNKEFQEKITNSERLVFIYPVWWNSMPAILKGWFDRVFTPHFAFKFHKLGPIAGVPLALLKGRKAVAFVTTGSSGLRTLLFLGNHFKTLLRTNLLGFFGIRTRVYHLGEALQVTDGNKARIRRLVSRGMGWVLQ